MISRGGAPPIGASRPSSAAGRMYIARMTAREEERLTRGATTPTITSPLPPPLHERCEIADRERGADEHGDSDRPELLLLREGNREDAHGEHERNRLCGRGHEGGYRRRRSFVYVRCPHVERRGRGLEGKP